MKKKKKNKMYPLGGALTKKINDLSGGVSNHFAGAVLEKSLSSIGDLISQLKNNDSNYPQLNQNTNQYGTTFEGGGSLKQFNAPSHSQGGQTIAPNGQRDNNSNLEIQNNETYKDGYVYSDKLTNPETGNKFNKDSVKNEKKYTKREPLEFDTLNNNAFEFDMKRLSKINDIVREHAEMKQQLATGNNQTFAGGGPTFDGSQVLRDMAGQAAQQLDDVIINPFDLNTIMNNAASKVGGNPYGDYVGGNSPDIESTNRFDNMGNVNTSDILRGITLAGDLKDSLTPALKESPLATDFTSGDRNAARLSSDLSQAVNNTLATRNSQFRDIDNSSSSVNVGIARKTQVGANTQNALSNIALQERQLGNTISQYMAGREDMKAGTLRNELYQNRIDNLQNEAAQHSFTERFRDDLTKVAQDLDMREVAKMEVEEFIAVTKSLGYNFNLGESKEFLKALKEGRSPVKFEK